MAGQGLSGFTQETMLRHHLQHNHYPPLPDGLVPFAARAIELANDGQWDEPITIVTDDGESTLLNGGLEVPVWRLVEDLHLDGFIDNPEED